MEAALLVSAGGAAVDWPARAGGGAAGAALLEAAGGAAVAWPAGAGGGAAGTALLEAAGGAAVAWPAGAGGGATVAALFEAAGGSAVGWPAGAGGGAEGTALLEAAGGAVEVSREVGDDICLIATIMFLAAVDCSLSYLVPQLSIAIYRIKCKIGLCYCKFIIHGPGMSQTKERSRSSKKNSGKQVAKDWKQPTAKPALSH